MICWFLCANFCTILPELHASVCSVPESRCCVCSTYKKHMGRRYWGHSHNYHPTGLTSLTPSPKKGPRGSLSPSKFSPRRHSPMGHYISPLRLRPRRTLSPTRLGPRKCLFKVECSLSLDLVCFAWVAPYDGCCHILKFTLQSLSSHKLQLRNYEF